MLRGISRLIGEIATLGEIGMAPVFPVLTGGFGVMLTDLHSLYKVNRDLDLVLHFTAPVGLLGTKIKLLLSLATG